MIRITGTRSMLPHRRNGISMGGGPDSGCSWLGVLYRPPCRPPNAPSRTESILLKTRRHSIGAYHSRKGRKASEQVRGGGGDTGGHQNRCSIYGIDSGRDHAIRIRGKLQLSGRTWFQARMEKHTDRRVWDGRDHETSTVDGEDARLARQGNQSEDDDVLQ